MLQAGTRPKKWPTDLSDIALKWRHLTNIIRRSECALWDRIGLFHLDNQFLLSYLIFCSNTFCKKHGPSQKIHPNIWTGLDGLDSTRLVCLDLQFCNIISALEKSPRINKLWQKFSTKFHINICTILDLACVFRLKSFFVLCFLFLFNKFYVRDIDKYKYNGIWITHITHINID